MAFSLNNDSCSPGSPEPDLPALSTCTNANAFHKMNAILGNVLDLSGVCTTPRGSPGTMCDREGSELGAVGSGRSMLFPSCDGGMPGSLEVPSTDSPGVADLCMGLRSLRLPSWDRAWSTQETNIVSSYTQVQTSSSSMMGILSGPSSLLGKSPSYLPPESTNGANYLNLLGSRSTSPEDSVTSGFSSASDHFCDVLSNLRISPPLPYISPNIHRDLLRLNTSMSAPYTSTPRQQQQQVSSANPSANSNRWRAITPLSLPDPIDPSEDVFKIERDAQLYKQAAAVNEPKFTWVGEMPPRSTRGNLFSRKVFLGGVPWDITEAGLLSAFSCFGPLTVEWPGKDGRHPRCPPKGIVGKGYVYLVFEDEMSVSLLLSSCFQQRSQSEYEGYYFKLSSRRLRAKDVQVIPWVLSDSQFVRFPTQRLDHTMTVFVGALHGMINAEGLAGIMDDLFEGVLYAGIDTDKYKYPIGSGRVTFNNQCSYLNAVCAAFVEVKTRKFTKKLQIDPYLQDSVCQICFREEGPFFCRDQACFKYYCRYCWHSQHSMDILSSHLPLMRNQRVRDSS